MDKLFVLSVKCPHCRASLMNNEKKINNKPSIHLNLKYNGIVGNLYLCALYGCFEHESDIKVDHDALSEFYCPHCKEALTTDVKCRACEAPMVTFMITSGGRMSFCSRRGCQKHYVAFQNLEDAIRKFHEEYSDH